MILGDYDGMRAEVRRLETARRHQTGRHAGRRATVNTLRVTAALALVAAWSWVGASPAGAHDELVASTPAADEHLATAPERVVLRFGGSPMEMGSTILVMDADGRDWVDAPPMVAGSEVAVALRAGMPDGVYQARWRVVSEDGAVISGFFDFGVGDLTDAATIAPPRSEDRDTSADAGDTSAEPSAAAAESPGDEPDEARSWGRLVVTAAVGALAGVGLLSVATDVARRRARHTTDVSSGPNPPTPDTTTQEDPL